MFSEKTRVRLQVKLIGQNFFPEGTVDMAKRNSAFDDSTSPVPKAAWGVGGVFALIAGVSLFAYLALSFFRVDVPTFHIAVLIKKTGIDLDNNQEVAPTKDHKGVQAEFLGEGLHWLNPYDWGYRIIPQEEIPPGKIGVLISQTGENLGYGELLAKVDPAKDLLNGGVLSKGIVPEVLVSGRHSINPYLFQIKIEDPVVIPAGFYGVVTKLSGPLPQDPNVLLVEPGFRGVQKSVLGPGTEPLNPYVYRVDLVDCRSQRFNLAENKDMGFPSKDGFWVSLDGIIEFHVNPEKAAEVFVTFKGTNSTNSIHEEVIDKVIMPIARSYCRVEGSKNSGREFIMGSTRAAFEENFEKVLRRECEPLGIVVLQALITNIRPPQQIAKPVRERELAKQDQTKFTQQILQQASEQEYAMEKEMVKRKQALVKGEQEVVTMTTAATQQQQVAVTKANERLAVAKLKLEAAEDQAEAIRARGKAEAEVITLNNIAEAAGWKRAVEAFSGNGNEFARYLLNQKLAPAYQKIMANSNDSPLMNVFEAFSSNTDVNKETGKEANETIEQQRPAEAPAAAPAPPANPPAQPSPAAEAGQSAAP